MIPLGSCFTNRFQDPFIRAVMKNSKFPNGPIKNHMDCFGVTLAIEPEDRDIKRKQV